MQFFHHTTRDIAQLAFAPNGKTLAIVADECMTLGLCNMVDGTYRAWEPGSNRQIQSIAYSPQGLLAVGDSFGTVATYKAGEYEYHAAHNAGDESGRQIPIVGLAFAPNRAKASVLAVASAGILLFDVNSGRQIVELDDHEASYSVLAWSPRGDIITAYEDDYDQVTLWRLNASLQPSKAITQYGLPSKCTSLAFSPDNHWLAMAHQKGVFLEDVRKRHGGPYQVLRGHVGPVSQVVFHPDGGRIATSSDDGTVRFWDFNTRREIKCYRWDIGKVRALAFSPDGMRCAVGGEEGRIVVWDVD
jgi:WD40 repeat protein